MKVCSKLLQVFLSCFLFLVFGLVSLVKAPPAQANLIEALRNPNTPSLEGFVAGYDSLNPNAPSGMGNILIDFFNLKLLGAVNEDGTTTSGVIHLLNNGIGMLYTAPASTPQYLASVYNDVIHPGQVQARTLDEVDYPGGFKVFEPVLGLWRAFRNVSYLAFIVMFVILGFMIMFRAKLNPQTAVSIQMALPKLIIALMGVTFSYALAALILDLGQLLTFLSFKTLLNPQVLHPNLLPDISNKLDLNVFNLIERLIGFFSAPENIDENIFGLSSTSIVVTIMGAVSGAVSILSLGNLNLWSLILSIVLVSSMFKIFFMLLTSYVQILFGVIFSPFIFLASALPSGKNPVGAWFRSQLANVLVFPVTFIILAIALLILNSSEIVDCFRLSGGCISGGTQPGAIVGQFDWTPELLPFNTNNIAAFIAFGIIMIVPNVAKMVQGALQVQPGAGGEIGENIRGVTKMIPLIGQFI